MKKLILFSLLISTTFSHAGVVGDWLGQLENSTGPTAYNSGARGYLSAGSVSASVPSNTEYLMSFSPPRLDAGACGVDLFLGGFSYMDIEYLGDKIEAIWQNADTVALSMAMSALSKTLDEKGLDFTEITDFLNSLQFNECEITKMGVTAVVDGGKWAYDQLYEEEAKTQEVEEGLTKNTQDSKSSAASNDGQPKSEVDISANIKACEQPIQDLLGGSGSIIQRLTSAHGISTHENLIRGYIGDIYLDHTGAADAPQIAVIPPCKENNLNSIDDFIYGSSQERSRPTSLNVNTTGTCSVGIINGGLLSHSLNMLNDLSSKLKNPTAPLDYNSALSKYLNSAPIPVYQIVKQANDIGIEQGVIGELSHIVAYSSAYSMINDLQKNTNAAFARLKATIASVSTNPTEKATADATSTVETKCDLTPYTGVIDEIGQLEKRLDFATTGLHQRYMAKIDELIKFISINEKYAEMGKKSNLNFSGGNK